MNIGPFESPFRVEVMPDPKGEADNIFLVDKTGAVVAIIAKHPVWNHLEKGRKAAAKVIVERLNEP